MQKSVTPHSSTFSCHVIKLPCRKTPMIILKLFTSDQVTECPRKVLMVLGRDHHIIAVCTYPHDPHEVSKLPDYKPCATCTCAMSCATITRNSFYPQTISWYPS